VFLRRELRVLIGGGGGVKLNLGNVIFSRLREKGWHEVKVVAWCGREHIMIDTV